MTFPEAVSYLEWLIEQGLDIKPDREPDREALDLLLNVAKRPGATAWKPTPIAISCANGS